MRRLEIHSQPQNQRTDVILASHILFSEEIASELKMLSTRFALFCDETVADLFGKRWCAHLQKLGLDCSLFTFGAGEPEKKRESKAELEDRLLSQKFSRDSCFIALGGGVTTDLIGFLASTYCRGVPLVFAPTTLLGMVDASIGGKTGVNTRFGKNLIGTFYPASKIFIDPALLSSLPPSEWTSGAAEVIKYALISSLPLFTTLKNWNPEDPAFLEKVIYTCVQIKAGIVEKDFEEKLGPRRILNFGHTIAHALELLENYHISHGEAVAIGMLVESDISMKMGFLPKTLFQEIETLIHSFPFALHLSPAVTVDAVRSAISLDKKSVHGAARFVLLEKIGACHPFDGRYCSEVPKSILDESLLWMHSQFTGGKR